MDFLLPTVVKAFPKIAFEDSFILVFQGHNILSKDHLRLNPEELPYLSEFIKKQFQIEGQTIFKLAGIVILKDGIELKDYHSQTISNLLNNLPPASTTEDFLWRDLILKIIDLYQNIRDAKR